jgi:flagellar assembly protein FliH
MSLSERMDMHATPWSLDEFVAHDVFLSSVPEEVEVEPAAPAFDPEAIEAEFDRRLAAECARVEAEAYARGRADGERAARAMLDDAIASALASLSTAMQSVQMHEARWVSNAEENIAALAVAVARHIVEREIAADPSLIAQLVARAVSAYPVDQEITIRVAPEDLALCRTLIDQDLHGARTLRWIADGSITRGGCLTEGRERIIDGRVDTGIERAYRAIAGVQA